MTRPGDIEPSAISTNIRDLLVRRAERIRRPEIEASAEDDVVWVAKFSVGDQEYAIALPVLRAAVPLRSVTPVPRSSGIVIGVLRFQGEVIAALSTATLLASCWTVDPTILLVVDAGDGHTVALDCAQVPVVVTIPLSAYQEAIAAAQSGLACVAVSGSRSVHILDLVRLLEKQDWGMQDAQV